MDSLPNELILKVIEYSDRKDTYRKIAHLNKNLYSLVHSNKDRLEWPKVEYCFIGTSSRTQKCFIRYGNEERCLLITDPGVFDVLIQTRIRFLFISTDHLVLTPHLVDLFSRVTVGEVIFYSMPHDALLIENILKELNYKRCAFSAKFTEWGQRGSGLSIPVYRWTSFPSTTMPIDFARLFQLSDRRLVGLEKIQNALPLRYRSANGVMEIAKKAKDGSIFTNREHSLLMFCELALDEIWNLKVMLDESTDWQELEQLQTENYNRKLLFEEGSVRIEIIEDGLNFDLMRISPGNYPVFIYVVTNSKRVRSHQIICDILRKASIWIA